MPLTKEWLHRIQRWESVLWETCYRPLGELTLSGFTTFDHLTADQASHADFSPMPPGTSWGAKWEYGWFKTRLVVPPDAVGQRLVFTAVSSNAGSTPWRMLVLGKWKRGWILWMGSPIYHLINPCNTWNRISSVNGSLCWSWETCRGWWPTSLWRRASGRSPINTMPGRRDILRNLARGYLPACCRFLNITRSLQRSRPTIPEGCRNRPRINAGHITCRSRAS